MSGPAQTTPVVTTGGREQLFDLLAEASEIEHTLMCSYLFAAFSLRRGSDSGLNGQEGEAVEAWRKVILSIAVEEMVHLLLVANLSIAIGGRPHFGRPNFPVEPGYFPAGVVVKLTRFSHETLEHFIFLERPKGSRLADAEGFEPETPYVREEAFDGLTPSIQDYATVGGLYDALRANLIASARRLGEGDLFLGPVTAQVASEAVDLPGVATVDGLASALQAIDTIVEQGEGSPSDREDSHYERFRAIRAEYRTLRDLNPSFDPAWPVAESPVMRRPPTPEGKTFVDAPDAARVLDLANAVYALLLQLVVQAFGRTGGRATADQARTLDAAIGLMHALAAVSDRLVRLPASPSAPGLNAGVSFTMVRSVEAVFLGGIEERLILERLTELATGARDASAVDPGLAGVAQAIEKLAVDYRADAA